MQRMILIITVLCLSACAHGPNQSDPYEKYNRKTYRFNQALDKALLKPAATVYRKIIPAIVRKGINNAYNNINMVPTVANDLLQAEWHFAIKDSWRFVINSTFGLLGFVDVANGWSLPPRSNDLGLTFAKWGDKNSPYFVIPLLGPSTFRDGMGLMFNYFLTPYPYINTTVMYSLVGFRYVDLRSQMQDTDQLIGEAFDEYTFIRDAYLQYRHSLMSGAQELAEDSRALYIDGDEPEPVRTDEKR